MYKYQYYRADNKIIAISTFAGKTVKGVAKCDPNDVFSSESGEELAAARCNSKIAAKRVKYAKHKVEEALKAYYAAKEHLINMNNYYEESAAKLEVAQSEVKDIIDRLA